MESQIRAARRELIPYTTGKVVQLKQDYITGRRKAVRLRTTSAVVIQKIYRGYLVRRAVMDPYRDFWIESMDEEQSESPFFYNTWSHETVWTMPLAYKYFCAPFAQVKPSIAVGQVQEGNQRELFKVGSDNTIETK